MPGKGIVLLSVNWGRRYGCPGVANAQLLRLTFRQLPITTSSPTLDLQTPGKLMVHEKFLALAYIVEPGTYAITDIQVLIATSLSDIDRFSIPGLVQNGDPVGGTFRVEPDEAVYIGSFGMDCVKGGVVPWRFYLRDRASFDQYIAEFKAAYPFAGTIPVRYRLFDSTGFGFPFSLPDEQPSTTAR